MGLILCKYPTSRKGNIFHDLGFSVDDICNAETFVHDCNGRPYCKMLPLQEIKEILSTFCQCKYEYKSVPAWSRPVLYITLTGNSKDVLGPLISIALSKDEEYLFFPARQMRSKCYYGPGVRIIKEILLY